MYYGFIKLLGKKAAIIKIPFQTRPMEPTINIIQHMLVNDRGHSYNVNEYLNKINK